MIHLYHYSHDVAVNHKRPPEKMNMTELHLPISVIKKPSLVELRFAAPNSKVRIYKAIPQNGDYLRDKNGNAIIGEFIKEVEDNG